MTDFRNADMHPVEQLAASAYAAIAEIFPICAASDEFYFFPQVLAPEPDWRAWDDFSQRRIADFADRLQGWIQKLAKLETGPRDDPARIDAELLRATLASLREQLVDIAPHRNQISFHLGILAAGLAEAFESGCDSAWRQRIDGLPDFLHRAAELLVRIPRLFHLTGMDMLAGMQRWLQQLEAEGRFVGAVPAALRRFGAQMEDAQQTEDFILTEDQFGRLLHEHLCCAMDPDAARRELELEFNEMDQLLREQAAVQAPGRRWQELEREIPFVAAPGGDLLALYRPELTRLAEHVRHAGFCPPEWVSLPAPQLREVAQNLKAVRASDAYNAQPGHPPRGGTFFVFPTNEKRRGAVGRTLEYRFTAVHETWPGHHLLDACRWNLSRPLRRPLERPLCYEGWACLAEELMLRSGYLTEPWDPFLLARRRIERAARGLVDLGLQSGRLNLDDAGAKLIAVGYPPARATAVIPKYALRPGYQACYSLGLRRLLEMLETYAPGNPAGFARSVLRQGQIGFDALEAVIRKEGVD